MNGKQATLSDNDYWLPYDAIMRHIPKEGKISFSSLKSRVHDDLKTIYPDIMKTRKGKVRRINLFPVFEFSRLVECSVIGFDGLTVRKGGE